MHYRYMAMLLEDRDREVKVPPRGVSVLIRGARSVRHSHLFVNLITIAITIAFSYVAIKGLDLKLAWRALQASNYWWLIPALVAFGMGTVARGLRWRSLFAPDRRPRRSTIINAMMIGYLYNNILPARAGEAARILVLTQRSLSPPVEITGTVMLERIYDLVAVLAIFLVAELWLPHVNWFGTAAAVALALALGIAAIAALLVVYGNRPLRLLLRPLRRLSFFHEDLVERLAMELTHGFSGLHNWRVAGEAFLWTIAAWLFSMVCAYAVTVAFHLQLPFAAGVLVMVAIGLSMILPSAPAAVGVFESAALIALQAYQVHRSSALPYALILHAVNFLPYLIVGGMLLRYNARHPMRSPRRSGVTDTKPSSVAAGS